MEESQKNVTSACRAYSLHRRRYMELWEDHEIRFGDPSLAKRISEAYSKKKPAPKKKDATKADKPKVGKPKKEKKVKADKPKKKKAPKEVAPQEESSSSSE
jgi:hypothetical protein